jgi:SOS response regulatory protein OraA/RecX
MSSGRIRFTVHARQRMALRGISEEMVSRTLQEPEEITVGYRSRKVAFRRFPKGRIKVVYREEQGQVVVITAMWQE